MLVLLVETQIIRDNPGFFEGIADAIASSRNRIEEVIGRGNLKWVILGLLLLLALWYMRRRRLSSF